MAADTPQRGSEFFDFDAWHAEHHGATIPFRLLGRDWDLPGDCDAAALLKLQRIEQWVIATQFADDDETVPLPDGLTQDDLTGFTHEGTCRALIGDTLVDQWLALHIPSEMLRAVSKRLYAIYAGRDADAAMGLPGKPQAATPKAPQDRKPKKKATTKAG